MEAKICVRCKKPCDDYDHPALTCNGKCGDTIHLNCLNMKILGPDSLYSTPLTGDVFFELMCSKCGKSGEDKLKRPAKFTWFQIILVAMYHLHQMPATKGSNVHFFKYDGHITTFIDKHWEYFRGREKKRKHWKGTISGNLSKYSSEPLQPSPDCMEIPQENWKVSTSCPIFQPLYPNSGLWKLKDIEPPIILCKRLRENKSKDHPEKNFKDLISITDHGNSPICSESSFSIGEDSNLSIEHHDLPIQNSSDLPIQNSLDLPTNNSILSPQCPSSEFLDQLMSSNDNLHGMDYMDNNQDLNSSYPLFDFINDFQYDDPQHESLLMADKFWLNFGEFNYDDSNDSLGPPSEKSVSSVEEHKVNTEQVSCDESVDAYDSGNVSASLFNTSRKRKLPWKKDVEETSPSSCSKMSVREEMYILERIEKYKDHLDSAPMSVKRLYRKLTLRKQKRDRTMPLLDVDGPLQESEKDNQDSPLPNIRIAGNFEQRLQGCFEPMQIYSPYTGKKLPPFIRADSVSRPLWLKVMEELLEKTNKKNPNWRPPLRAPIIFSYIRPQHLSAINSLCNRFFWDGNDVSECLEYPDFSCVVTYKKLIVGFAIMVPDLDMNEAYLSFILTRPEWRNAGIGTYMMYHLMQVCRAEMVERDITLHVSASNSALLFYDKFGFKVDEFMQNFYDKFMPPSSWESRHAYYLRMAR